MIDSLLSLLMGNADKMYMFFDNDNDDDVYMC